MHEELASVNNNIFCARNVLPKNREQKEKYLYLEFLDNNLEMKMQKVY